MKASELIEHLSSLIEKHGDLPVVGMGMDGDFGIYSMDSFTFEKGELVKQGDEYEYCSYKDEPTVPVFITNI